MITRERPCGRAVGCAVAALLLAAVSAVHAYTLEPTVATVRLTGAGSSTFFRLQNRESRPAAIEITVHEHRKDLDGQGITGAAADDDFIVYPAQLVMLPGDEASVQVRWAGDPALATERAYTLVTREVAIPRVQPSGQASEGVRVDVTVLLNYQARLYVAPPGARPRLQVESVQELPAQEAPGASPQVDVILANPGSAHQVLSELSLLFIPLDAAGNPLRQQAVRVAAAGIPAARPHLLAGERRRLRLPRPAQLPAGRFDVQLAP